MMNNITVSIPPFPSQDLAKLVLGYLAEEQLMTAYDEFLQASPYLDAFQNEYDRIFMTSLRNILAEYRAVKIYVETCSPFILRRKLFQCPNLLEVVKFLVKNVDINKLHVQEESVDKLRQNRYHSFSKSNVCDLCISLKYPNCVCKASHQSISDVDTLETSVMTTSLADLPGNSSKKSTTKAPVTTSNICHPITSSDQVKNNEGSKKYPDIIRNTSAKRSGTMESMITSAAEKNISSNSNLWVTDQESNSRQIVQDLNDVLNLVSHNRSDNIVKHVDCNDERNATCKRKGGAETSQDFATESDVSNINKAIVPDSSTSENVGSQSSTYETEVNKTSVNKNTGSTGQQGQQLININENKNFILPSNTDKAPISPFITTKEPVVKTIQRKTEERSSSKIKILSDVKIDSDIILPSVLKNTTSTSLLHLPSLFINDAPGLKQIPQLQKNYTQDEIMAMPTIILVPSSDNSKKTVNTFTQSNTSHGTNCAASTRSTGPAFEPLVIDISTSDTDLTQINGRAQVEPAQATETVTRDNMLLSTVEVTSHMSLPKENTLSGLKTTTPQDQPPTRKSSSTPRRTSHIRVLDFTTPRRILHETINEQGVNPSSVRVETPSVSATMPLTRNNSNEAKEPTTNTSNTSENIESNGEGSSKENKTSLKLYNWDSKLRALAYAGNGNIEKSDSSQRTKSKKSKKKVSPTINSSNKCKEVKIIVKKSTEQVATSSTKSKKKSSEVIKDNINEKANITSIPVKPTINIICRDKWGDPIDIDKSQNKSNNGDVPMDTPELERMSLQNEIGAKLNISDFLETPYKQALYDIQMETPKFLGPDIPGDPLSDIKIMNIPTPRFLNTPKVLQNTPSSYSSRPTDYSSGGSYYKPDDQDYVLATEVMESASSVNTVTAKIKSCKTDDVKDATDEKNVSEAKSRPVRTCTKNVSYNYASSVCSSKIKSVDDGKDEKSSTCSDISINKVDKNINKNRISKCDSNKKENKIATRKKSKRLKLTPKKEPPKTFMKIKPRRTTPVKEVLGKGRKKNSEYSPSVYLKPLSKRLIAGKDKKVSFVSEVMPVLNKSRRKSSTPRKLHCTKIFSSGSSELNSPDRSKEDAVPKSSPVINGNDFCNQGSDSEQASLHWSDNEPQDSKPNANEENQQSYEGDDITKIKEYINKTEPHEVEHVHEGTLHVDLIKRGFDADTARMIERDLLETPTQNISSQRSLSDIPSASAISQHKLNDESEKADKNIEPNSSTSNNVQIGNDLYDNNDLSVHETNEDTNNYRVYKYDEAKFVPSDQITFKETFSMEICIEDEVAIRLRAMPFKTLFEKECLLENGEVEDCNKKTTEKPKSPRRFDTLYTPRKAQCYEIFDSTLDSLDTPLKSNSPKTQKLETAEVVTIEEEMETVLEVEKLVTNVKHKPESKRRKRVLSGTSDESSNGSKKLKPNTSYILNSASIQNIDIESVLSKLHGP